MRAAAPIGLRRLRVLAAVTLSMTVTAMVFGFSFPMFSTRMATMGFRDSMIGLNASAQALGVFAVIWFAAGAVARHGPVVVMLAMAAVKLLAVLACMVFPDFWPWLVLRLVIGAAGSVLWIAGETWVNEAAREESRGRELAIYSAALGIGTVAGNKIVEVAGFQGWLPFAALAAVVAVSVLPLFLVLGDSPRLGTGQRPGAASLLAAFRQAPLPIVLNGAFAAVFVSLHAFITVYGLEVGMALERAIHFLIVFNLGGIVMPYAAGWLADRIDRTLLALLMVLACALLFAVMGQALSRPGIDYPYIFLLGGLSAAVYAVALVLLGERFRGAELASATAAFTLMWNVGAAAGPALAGAAMERLGAPGLPVALALMSAAVLPLALRSFLARRCG